MRKVNLLLFALLVLTSLVAQDLSKLTPEQLAAYKKYKEGNNNAITNTTQDKVTERTVENGDDQTPVETAKGKVAKTADYKTVEKKAPRFSGSFFGSYLFNGQNLTFEPKLNIPTPPKYILGTYDELIVDISGLYEANYKIKVSPEGFIRIPNISPIKVSGQTIEDASRTIRNRLSKIYPGVSNGSTQINITLGTIRSIRITVVGEATRPGTYTLPSLASAFNALYACGGPDSIGSMRDIKVVRRGKIVANVDVYGFLLDGALTNNIPLQDEDVLKIEPYKVRVTIKGAIKRDGIYEALPGETLQQLVRFAGGYNDNAYKKILTAFRLTEKGKTIIDVSENQIPAFNVQSGDSFLVSTTSTKYDNRVDIRGAVYRPGAYSLEKGLTIKQLIEKADGLKEDAYLNMAFINRKQANQVPEIIGFNLGGVMHGVSEDIALQKDDSIVIRSLFEYREGQSVSVWGAVQQPGSFKLLEKVTLKDVIFKARGFTEMANTDSVELVRIIKDPSRLLNTNEKTIVMKFAMDRDLNFKGGMSDMILENGDQVIVRTISGYEGVRMVRIEGEVIQPGTYNITNKAERISDLLKRAGGFTKYAYPLGAYLIRTEKQTGVEQKLNEITKENAKKQFQTKEGNKLDATLLKTGGGTNTAEEITNLDSVQNKMTNKGLEKVFKNEGIVGINLVEILKRPGGKNDFFLEEGDDIFVPRELQTVRVMGEVLFPTYVGYEIGVSLKRYIDNAGGFSVQAEKKKVFVLYANGTAKSTRSFLGIRLYPKVQPGSRIVVPEKPTEIQNKMSTVELIGILSSISTMAALIYSVTK